MDDGEKLADVVGTVLEKGSFEEFGGGDRVSAGVEEHALVFHLAGVARAGGIDGDSGLRGFTGASFRETA